MPVRSTKIFGTVGIITLALASAFLSGGCVSKSKARDRARMAYLAGQQQAMKQALPPAPGPNVTFIGPVKNPVQSWSEGLTLSQALTTAIYSGATDPAVIIIRRNGQPIVIDPARVLAGEDIPLQSGDIVELVQ